MINDLTYTIGINLNSSFNPHAYAMSYEVFVICSVTAIYTINKLYQYFDVPLSSSCDSLHFLLVYV